MIGSDFSGKRSRFSESRSEHGDAGERSMSSVVRTQLLTRDVAKILAPHQGWKKQVSAVHNALTNKKFEQRIEDLTWNRVRSWFFGEARRVDYEEVIALQELKAVEEAKRARRELGETIDRLEALLTAPAAGLGGEEVRELGRLAGALDRAGIKAAGDGDAR
ncbi:hypothetical protein [Aminobacter aminovorans]|uniref:Uncharacterized protein n=1 Tax=Aminobacter aminovorans TaxID=83263 RepID=A0AAC8YPE2_AMIAI|nr:hypothetical protein [Aminobacter aminovorans]AMS41196.1 hypothetical protein AA2016_2268 [Aminobacter aminovorans]MBB3705821.1 hypothetical protein [Aminobacter aminovorans]